MKNEIEVIIAKWQKDNIVRNLSPDSILTYNASIRDFTNFLTERSITKFKQINSETIQDYVLVQLNRGCLPRTINNRLKGVRRLLNFYAQNYKHNYELPKIVLQREVCTERGPLSDSEVCKLIKNFSPKDSNSVIVAFALDTALRSKSIRNICVGDLDLDNGTVIVRVTKNRDILVLPLSKMLNNLLKEYIIFNKMTDEAGYLFPNNCGGRLYDHSSLYKRVNKYMKKCGVKKSGTHLFRYTFGRILIENNCNAMLLQQWFGHRTMEETKKYLRLYSSELKQVCEQVTPLSKNGKILKLLNSEL